MITEQFQTHIAYMLDEDEKYSLLAVKTLAESDEESLLKARLISRNGRGRIIYNTEGMGSYLSLCNDMNDRLRIEVLSSLADAINVVSNSAFWELEYLDLRKEQIYIDRATEKVRYAVVPRVFNDMDKAGIEWTERLLVLVSETVRSMNDTREVLGIIRELDVINQMTELLERHRETIKLIKILIGIYGKKQYGSKPQQGAGSSVRNVVLEYVSEMGHFSFIDNLKEFVIGSGDGCNGWLNISRAVSKKHCMIVKEPNRVLITDLGSTNGTWINGSRVMPNEYAVVNNNDIVKLADIQFRVHFEY